jgi:DNA-binding NarL/FixJ family response regulator
MGNNTKILLADDHEIMREGLCALLRKHDSFDIVAEAADGRTAVRLAREKKPDIVIIDIGMPNLNGIEATRQVINENPYAKVMALSTHSEMSIVAKALKAGASGYMLKESAFNELIDGINTIKTGKTYLCNKIAEIVFSDYVNMLNNPRFNGFDILSNREKEVLQLVSEGKTTKEIANTLHLSPKTIDSHREHIMDKLGIRSIAELTRYAIKEGLTYI